MADFELPGYEIYERIGKGGMAMVYRALHYNLDREVAIKVMDPAMNSDEQFSERFVREARISAQLVHPHILQIYDVNVHDTYNYIAMELLSGGDLGDLIHTAMPQKMVYQIMEQMTTALDYAYSKGYVHRDIKPSNIMLRSPVEYVLADFGIARAADSGTQMTQTGLMVGTPSYMSPEQAKGLELDGRSDLYALAILFYEMMTKQLPYESESPVTTAIMHLTEAIPTLPEQVSCYQPFIEKAMAKSADDRYQTGREMFAALMEASAGIDEDTVLTPAVERKQALGSSSTTVADPNAPPLSTSERTRVSGSSPRSRPYKLKQTSPTSQMARGLYADRPDTPVQKKADTKSGSKVPMLLGLIVVIALGAGGYVYWQEQQYNTAPGLGSITGELASAYSAMNENELDKAASSFAKVLSIDSSNAAAQAGMSEIEALFEQGLTAALASKDAEGGRSLYSDYSLYFSSSGRWAELGASLDQMEQEQRLAAVQEERITILLERMREEIANVDLEAATLTLEQASSFNSAHPAVIAAGETLLAAQAEAAANEERWSVHSPEQREEFEALILAVNTAWEESDHDEVDSLLQQAAAIAPEMPNLVAEQEKLATWQEALAELVINAEAAVAQSAEDLGQAGIAVDLFNQILELDTDNTVAVKGLELLSVQLIETAQESLAIHDYAKAEQTLAQAVDWLPEQAELAELLVQVPELRQAYQDAQKQQADKLARVAELLQQAGDGMSGTKGNAQKRAEVAGLFTQVLELEPNNAEAAAGISKLTDQAVAEANTAIKASKFSAAGNILAAANAALPNQSKIRSLQQRLPGLEKVWRDKQAAQEQARAIELAERRKAISMVSSGRVALSEGNIGGARLAYERVASSFSDLNELAVLQRELQAAYILAARQQIEINEYDTAMDYVDQGLTLTPRNREWNKLKEEIETLQAGPTRRRLGAY